MCLSRMVSILLLKPFATKDGLGACMAIGLELLEQHHGDNFRSFYGA